MGEGKYLESRGLEVLPGVGIRWVNSEGRLELFDGLRELASIGIGRPARHKRVCCGSRGKRADRQLVGWGAKDSTEPESAVPRWCGSTSRAWL